MQTNQEHEKNTDQEKKTARQKQEQRENSDRQPESPEFRSRRAFLGKVAAPFRSRRRAS